MGCVEAGAQDPGPMTSTPATPHEPEPVGRPLTLRLRGTF
jgi:hypothetical protein